VLHASGTDGNGTLVCYSRMSAFAECSFVYRALLQKRPMFLKICLRVSENYGVLHASGTDVNGTLVCYSRTRECVLQHTTTHCNTLQHTATQCCITCATLAHASATPTFIHSLVDYAYMYVCMYVIYMYLCMYICLYRCLYVGQVHMFVMYACMWMALTRGYGVQSSSDRMHICMYACM